MCQHDSVRQTRPPSSLKPRVAVAPFPSLRALLLLRLFGAYASIKASYATSSARHASTLLRNINQNPCFDLISSCQALDRVGDWSAALAAKKANDSKMPSPTSGFDEDVLQLLGADFIPPKEVADMTADDVAERIASAPVTCPLLLAICYRLTDVETFLSGA